MNKYSNEENYFGVHLRTELLQFALNNFPSVFMTENCELTEVSEKFRSCCADNANRTFFTDILDDAAVETLKKRMYADETCFSFKLCYRRYRYGFVKKLPLKSERIAVVFLAENIRSLLILHSIFTDDVDENERISLIDKYESQNESFHSSLRALMNPYDEIGEWEGLNLIKALIGRLSSHRDFYPYKINFEQGNFSANHKMSVHSGGCALLLMSALNILGPLSGNGKIDVMCACEEFDFRVEVSAKLPCDVKLRGETDKPTALAGHIPVSFVNLVIAELAAFETGMYVTVSCDERELKVKFGSRMVAEPDVRFNFRDPEERAEAVFGLIVALFTAVAVSSDK